MATNLGNSTRSDTLANLHNLLSITSRTKNGPLHGIFNRLMPWYLTSRKGQFMYTNSPGLNSCGTRHFLSYCFFIASRYFLRFFLAVALHVFNVFTKLTMYSLWGVTLCVISLKANLVGSWAHLPNWRRKGGNSVCLVGVAFMASCMLGKWSYQFPVRVLVMRLKAVLTILTRLSTAPWVE